MRLDDGRRGIIRHLDHIARGNGAGCGIGRNEDEFHRPVDVAGKPDPRTVRREGRIHLQHRLIGIRHDLHSAVGQLRMRGIIMPVHEHHARCGNAVEDRGIQQPFDLARGRRHLLARRIGLVDHLAQVGPAPLFHAPVRQGKSQRLLRNRLRKRDAHAASFVNSP